MVVLLIPAVVIVGFGWLFLGVSRGWRGFVARPNAARLEEWHRRFDERLLETGDFVEAVAFADRDELLQAEIDNRPGREPEWPAALPGEPSVPWVDEQPVCLECERLKKELRRDVVTVALPTEQVEVCQLGEVASIPIATAWREVTLGPADLRRAAEEKLQRDELAARFRDRPGQARYRRDTGVTGW